MPSRIEIGGHYATVSGLPVLVIGIDGENIVLQSMASDNRLRVPRIYPLRPFRVESVLFELRAKPYSRRLKGAASATSESKKRVLAPIIDAMLLAGNKTMQGMVRELKRKASSACKGKDAKANIRARIYWLRKRGFRIERVAGHIRALRP